MYFCSMLKNRYLILICVICLVAFASCGNHTQILKSTDNEYKYNSAMHYYGQKDYNRALQLFDVLQSAYRGKPQGEDIAYYTAECYYNMKDYNIASHYYKRYAVNYPFAKNVEAALFRSACCYYLESPGIELDQEEPLFTDIAFCIFVIGKNVITSCTNAGVFVSLRMANDALLMLYAANATITIFINHPFIIMRSNACLCTHITYIVTPVIVTMIACSINWCVLVDFCMAESTLLVFNSCLSTRR